MSRKNKFGISDYIPAETKREIRQICGFGCVVCGSPFYDYEHWNPEFEKLQGEHRAEGITLCCPNCHRKKGGLLSIQEYRKCIENPIAKQNGFIKTNWSGVNTPKILLGNIECLNINNILTVDGSPILALLKPEKDGAPPRLIARFFDSSGSEQFRIDHNECIGNPSAWDITSTKIGNYGWKWTVRKAKGEIDLELSLYPPDLVEINKLRMRFGTLEIRANAKGFQVIENTSDLGLINRVFISGGTVSANGDNHVFFGVDRKYILNPATRIATVQHQFSQTYVTLDGSGCAGKLSYAENEKII